jgi:hypothetical protein
MLPRNAVEIRRYRKKQSVFNENRRNTLNSFRFRIISRKNTTKRLKTDKYKQFSLVFCKNRLISVGFQKNLIKFHKNY